MLMLSFCSVEISQVFQKGYLQHWTRCRRATHTQTTICTIAHKLCLKSGWCWASLSVAGLGTAMCRQSLGPPACLPPHRSTCQQLLPRQTCRCGPSLLACKSCWLIQNGNERTRYSRLCQHPVSLLEIITAYVDQAYLDRLVRTSASLALLMIYTATSMDILF